MSHGGSSATQNPLEVRRNSGGKPHQPAKIPMKKKKRNLAGLAAVILILMIVGACLILWAFKLPQQKETPAPVKYRPSLSMHGEVSSDPSGSQTSGIN